MLAIGKVGSNMVSLHATFLMEHGTSSLFQTKNRSKIQNGIHAISLALIIILESEM